MTEGDDLVQRRPWGDCEGGVAGVLPAQRLLAHRLLTDVRHGADLAVLADAASARWTDALLAETRFHLASLMNAVELALALELGGGPAGSALAQLGGNHARQAIEVEMALLSPSLVGHLRLRAAVSLLLRHNHLPGRGAGREDSLAAVGGETGNDRYLDSLAALGIAERRWHGPMLLDAPMRPDLPAEHYHDLVWTVTALLIRGCERLGGGPDPAMTAAFAQAAQALISRHDEGQGAFALAQRCARSLPSPMRFALAPAALTEARLLLFAALVECEAGLRLEDVLECLIGGRDADRHALLRLMGIDDAVAFRCAELLAPASGTASGGDAALVEFVQAYRAFDALRAAQWLTSHVSPRALADKLALLEGS